MKELLTEFLRTILSEKNATKDTGNPAAGLTLNLPDTKPPEAKFSRGGKWYSDAGYKDYVGRMYQGKWIPATAAEKEQEKNGIELVDKGQSAEPDDAWDRLTHQMQHGTGHIPMLGKTPSTPAKKQAAMDATLQKATGGKASRTTKIDRNDEPSEPVHYVGGIDDRLDANVSKEVADTFAREFPLDEAQHEDITRTLEQKGAKETGVKVTTDDISTVLGLQPGQNPSFPPKYISAITNLLNYRRGRYTITDLTGTAGAGTLDSTSGELLGMIGMSISDETQRDRFFDYIEEQMVKGGKTSPITQEWIDSARATAKAFHRKLTRDCPGGHEIVSSFWDIPAEAKAAGVKNYKATKGKSTDVNVVVDCKGTDGKTVRKWYQPSLKKDKKVNGFNGSTSRVYSVMVYRYGNEEQIAEYDSLGAELDSYGGLDPKQPIEAGSTMTIAKRKTIIGKRMEQIESDLSKGHVPPEADARLAKERQQKLHREGIEVDLQVVDEFDTTLQAWASMTPEEKRTVAEKISRMMAQGEDFIEETIKRLDELSENREDVVGAAREGTLAEITGFLGLAGDTSDRQKMNMAILTANIAVAEYQGEDASGMVSSAYRQELVRNAQEHPTAVLNFLTSSTENRMALMRSISSVFPLKDLMEGRENAILGEGDDGINLDQHTIRQCLGLKEDETFDDVVERLTIVCVGKKGNTLPVDTCTETGGKPVLVYSGGGDIHVPIGLIRVRPNGIGYNDSWKLEMTIHEGFSNCAKQHDE
jgi:hypothetical protein